MTSRSGVFRAALCAAMVPLAAVGARADFVTIGNPGNAAASATNTTHGQSGAYGYGAVPYTYQISETAVSIAEWEAFYTDANSGKVGTFNLAYNYWNDGMRTVGPNAPAVYISFNQAAQYCNWLTTGNATQGAYTIDGTSGAVTSIMSRADILASGNQYFVIPTEDEWYKAAYFKTDGTGYSLYAHGFDTIPLRSSDADRAMGWVYHSGSAFAYSSPNYVRPVGSGPAEQNGTLNMMGNVWEWNEALIGSNRGLRGGSFYPDEDDLRASTRIYGSPTDEYSYVGNVGFRVASIIPEPASVSMLLMGAVAALLWRRRRNA